MILSRGKGGEEEKFHLWETERPLFLFHRTSCWSEGREHHVAGRSPSAVESHRKNTCTIWFNSPSQIRNNKLIVKARLKAALGSNLFKGRPRFTDPACLLNSKSAAALPLSGTSCFSPPALPPSWADLDARRQLSAPVLGKQANYETSRCRITVWFNLPEA